MPITVDWYPEPYIRRTIISGVVPVSEVETWMQGELAIVSSQSHVVHFITDVSGLKSSQAQILTMDSVKKFMQHPNTGWIAVVGMTPIVSFVSLMLQRFVKMNFMPFDSTEKAQAY